MWRSVAALARRQSVFAAAAASSAATTLYLSNASFCDSSKDAVAAKNDNEAPSESEKIVGRYENRLRRFSSPERVFQYFASIRLDKQPYMTRQDFIRALTPYSFRKGDALHSKNPDFNPMITLQAPKKEEVNAYKELIQEIMRLGEHEDWKKSPELKKEMEVLMTKLTHDYNMDLQTHLKVLRELNVTYREFQTFIATHGGPEVHNEAFFDLVDADGDGLISYPEFMFFTTLLSIPERQFELAFKMFDDDGNGVIDHREFKEIMDLMRLRTPSGRQDRHLKENSTPTFKNLFGEWEREPLTFEKFCAFRNSLKREVMRLHFDHYDVDGSKELSAREFGMFLVSHVKQTEMDQWVEKVDKLHDLELSITEQEFMDYYSFLENLDAMKVAMELVMEKNGLDKDQFYRAARAACHGGRPLVSKQIVDIIFALFDESGDGAVSPDEFLGVMESRRSAGLRERRDLGALEFLERVKSCFLECVAEMG
ncbi:hypothetical protein LEN26_020991 [Aphanomyces euteiches]|nr:hypothetical protein LEN26_020991 [Aphanomyces euteiches]KAH9125232.1 hypothetical protein AeMF1_004115 [Aphanomyces euteiches]KAH9192811.1 hypothetical protein AeNC1_005218 [Aphanomyces euteiches]